MYRIDDFKTTKIIYVFFVVQLMEQNPGTTKNNDSIDRAYFFVFFVVLLILSLLYVGHQLEDCLPWKGPCDLCKNLCGERIKWGIKKLSNKDLINLSAAFQHIDWITHFTRNSKALGNLVPKYVSLRKQSQITIIITIELLGQYKNTYLNLSVPLFQQSESPCHWEGL